MLHICRKMVSCDNVRKLSVIVLILLLIVDIIYLRFSESRGSGFPVPRMLTNADKIAGELQSSALRNVSSVSHSPAKASRWIVISIAVNPKMSNGYIFCLPLTVAAWKRIGWHSLIIVTGDIEYWNNSTLLKLVKQTTLDIDNTARFVTIPVTHNPVSYAQVSRSFAVLVAPWIQPDEIVMTSDIDIVPLKGEFYDMVNGSEIFILNADCCGTFSWKGQSVLMQPMTSIGMSARNWIKVMDLEPLKNSELFSSYLNIWLQVHYGRNISEEDVQKGDNENWYLDQRVVSIQLHHSDIKQKKVRRQTGSDRVDRAYGHSWRDFKNHVDAHVYLDPLTGTHWDATMLLIKDIFAQEVANQLIQFKENFIKINTST